jgi:tetratricopeptide (TPR) repeat protein
VRGLVYCSVIGGCQLVYAVERAREWTTVLADWCEGQPQLGLFTGICRVHRAELMQLGGNWSDALQEIHKLSGDGDRTRIERAGAAYQEAEIHRLRGEYALAEAAYARAAEQGGDTQPGLALLRLAQGQTDAAQGGIRRAFAAASEPLRRARYLSAYVEIMLATGALEEAATISAELDATVRLYNTPVLRAMAARAAGSVALARGELATALPLLRDAFAIWQELDAPFIAARLRTEIAEAYEALGDADGARLER